MHLSQLTLVHVMFTRKPYTTNLNLSQLKSKSDMRIPPIDFFAMLFFIGATARHCHFGSKIISTNYSGAPVTLRERSLGQANVPSISRRDDKDGQASVHEAKHPNPSFEKEEREIE